MSKSSISLTVDSGPKKGETLDRKPGSIIRIGRVVKGNTLTIKDPSISQKHLAIEFDPVASQWVLRDLVTSNGTFVNGGLLPSSSSDSPVPLSDGDVIKIGDSTSISVRVSPIETGNGGRRTRNRKKDEILEPDLDERVEVPENLGRNSSEVKENKDEVVDDGRMKISENLGRGRRGRSAAVSKKDEILQPGLDENIELPENTERNCANVKENRDESVVDKRMKVSENLGRGRTLRARVSKKEEILDTGLEDERIDILENSGRKSLDVKESKDEAVEDGSKVPENLGRGRGRRGKATTVSKKDEVVQVDIINAAKNLRRGRRTISIQISEKDPSMDLIAEDTGGNSSCVLLENENLEPPVEGHIKAPPKKLGRGRRNSKKEMVLEDKNEAPKANSKKEMVLEDKNEAPKAEKRRRVMSIEVSEEDDILNLVVADKNSVPKNENLPPFVEASKNLGRGRRNSKKDAVLEDKNEVPKTTGRGRRSRSAKVSEEYDILNSFAEDKVSVPKNAGRGRRTRVSKLDETLNLIKDDSRTEAKKKLGRGKQRANSSKASKTDERLDDIVEDAVVKAKPRRVPAQRTRASSSKISKDEQLLEPPLDFKNPALNPVESPYQLKELREDFHRLSKQDKIQQISLLSSSAADSKDKRSESKEGKENCFSVKCQKTKDETVGTQTDKPSRVVPKVWIGNGIPNSTTKYKEDQKISWHDTPFEERVERALSDDKLFPQRNLTN